MTEYACVMADPPWDKSDRGTTVRPRNWSSVHHSLRPAGNNGPRRRMEHYSVMTEEAITALPIDELAAKRAHLWLWSLNATMETAYRVIRAWQFEPQGVITWRKVGRNGRPVVGMGKYFRMSSEQLIFAVRGTPALLPSRPWIGTVIDAPRTEHSRKPDAFYDLAEHVSPAPRLELFARRRRLGWDAWGDGVDSDIEVVT